jgi:hypothetical protein
MKGRQAIMKIKNENLVETTRTVVMNITKKKYKRGTTKMMRVNGNYAK